MLRRELLKVASFFGFLGGISIPTDSRIIRGVPKVVPLVPSKSGALEGWIFLPWLPDILEVSFWDYHTGCYLCKSVYSDVEIDGGHVFEISKPVGFRRFVVYPCRISSDAASHFSGRSYAYTYESGVYSTKIYIGKGQHVTFEARRHD